MTYNAKINKKIPENRLKELGDILKEHYQVEELTEEIINWDALYVVDMRIVVHSWKEVSNVAYFQSIVSVIRSLQLLIHQD